MYKLYSKIINAKIIKVDSIKIAEAAKIIENSQRDVNIALMNEFETIFDKMNINSKKVFEAAYTKWNFLKFKPGLVGGHYIGIEPYYLIDVSKKNNYLPKLISESRNINENIPSLISNKILNNFPTQKKLDILILGTTFKENCSDLRNSRVLNIFNILKRKNHNVSVYDPVAISKDMKFIYKKNNIDKLKNKYNVILLLVPHSYFVKLGISKIKKFLYADGLIFDYKYIFSKKQFIKL